MAPDAQEMQQKLELRPTLLIGLGGTGQKVLVNVKARFLRNYRGVPPVVRFLCFDTDQAVEQVRMDGEVVKLVPDVELINIGGIETQNILSNLERHPAISRWITEDKEKMPTQAIVMGAKCVRPLGRLAFFWRAEDIARKLNAAVRALTDMKLPYDAAGINVFIVSSVCGGTGSGAILDVAYMIRHIISKEVGIKISFCYINGILALPSVFPQVTPLGIDANAFAALAEIDYFMETGEWQCEYGPQLKVEFKGGQPPFNICYLIEGGNEQGRGLGGLEEVAPMVAEAVYLQINTQVGTASNSVFDNVDALSGRAQDNEGHYHRTSYSSFGTSALVFPVDKIIATCANRLGRHLVEGSLLKADVNATQLEETVSNFIKAHQLAAVDILPAVSRDAKGKIIGLQLDAQALDQYKEAQLAQETQKYLQRAENAVENEFAQTLEQNRKKLETDLAAPLAEEIDRLVDDPAYGLRFGLAFVERLGQVLAGTQAALDKEGKEIEGQRDKALSATKQSWAAFLNAFQGGPFGKGRRIKEARNLHVQTYGRYLTARLEGRKRVAGVALLASLSSTVQGHRAALQGLADRLGFIQGRFAAFEEQGREGDRRDKAEPTLVQITAAQDIDRYYQEHLQRLGATPVATLLEAEGPLHTWREQDQAAITDRILRHTRGIFADVAQVSLEQVILEKKDQVDPLKRLRDQIKLSVPFWRFQREGVLASGQEPFPIRVIGVHDKEHSIYSGSGMLETNETLTSTFDPHRIIIFQTKHGLPLFALLQYAKFREAHDHVIQAGIKPLYVFPEVRPGGQRAKQIFAVSAAYGLVFKSGTYYYLLAPNPVDPPIRLAQGMSQALSIFRNNEAQIRQVTDMVDEQIGREGTAAAITALEKFVREPYIYEMRGGLTKERPDRSRMTPDTSVGRPGNDNYELIVQLQHAVQEYVDKVLRG